MENLKYLPGDTKATRMDKDNEDPLGNVIPFPTNRLPPETIDSLEIPESSVQDLVIAVACVNMASKYKGAFDEQCKESLEKENFPCSANCGCYIHMLSSMALELIFEGPRTDEARKHLYQEYAALCDKRLPPESDDEY